MAGEGVVKDLQVKLNVYYLTAIFSLVFALLGFSYNAWRLEASEDNNNIRTASFEVLLELAELEQLVFAAHYDQDPGAGNPRTGWVKVGLINDLSGLISEPVEASAEQLRNVWSGNWTRMKDDQAAADTIIASIDTMRKAIKVELKSLK